jgi:hypothetical protein
MTSSLNEFACILLHIFHKSLASRGGVAIWDRLTRVTIITRYSTTTQLLFSSRDLIIDKHRERTSGRSIPALNMYFAAESNVIGEQYKLFKTWCLGWWAYDICKRKPNGFKVRHLVQKGRCNAAHYPDWRRQTSIQSF